MFSRFPRSIVAASSKQLDRFSLIVYGGLTCPVKAIRGPLFPGKADAPGGAGWQRPRCTAPDRQAEDRSVTGRHSQKAPRESRTVSRPSQRDKDMKLLASARCRICWRLEPSSWLLTDPIHSLDMSSCTEAPALEGGVGRSDGRREDASLSAEKKHRHRPGVGQVFLQLLS